jgi:hypothetical protein
MNLPTLLSRLAQLGLRPTITDAGNPIAVVFDVGNTTGTVLRGQLGERAAKNPQDVEPLLAEWQKTHSGRVGPVRFVQERLNETRWAASRPAWEIDALERILQTAYGCPGCGARSGRAAVAHACPGGRDRRAWSLDMAGPADPWRSVVLNLTRLWAAHPDYDPRWHADAPEGDDDRRGRPQRGGDAPTR